MATITNFYCDPPGYGLKNGTSWDNAYPSVYSGMVARKTSLVAADAIYKFNCRCSSASTYDTVPLSAATVWNGYTTDVNRYVEIRCDDGTYLNTGAGDRITTYATSGAANVVLYGLKVTSTNTGNPCFLTRTSVSGVSFIVDRCIFRTTGGNYALRVNATTSTGNCVVRNSIFLDSAQYCSTFASTLNNFVYNSLAYSNRNSAIGFSRSTATVTTTHTIQNCVAVLTGTSTDPFNANWNTTKTNNASSPADATHAGSSYVVLTGYSPQQIWVDPVNLDFHLKAGSPLIGIGIQLTGATYPVTDDLDGITRNAASWDIGPYKYIESAMPEYIRRILVT